MYDWYLSLEFIIMVIIVEVKLGWWLMLNLCY